MPKTKDLVSSRVVRPKTHSPLAALPLPFETPLRELALEEILLPTG